MTTSTIVPWLLTAILVAALGVTAGAQTAGRAAGKGKQPAAQSPSPVRRPLVNADSLRRYLRAVERSDSAELRRYGDIPPAEDLPGRARILLLTRMDRDSIVLRWAPSNAGGWAAANRAGYSVERMTLRPDGKPDTSTVVRLTQGPRIPWTREEWNRYAQRTNRYAMIAAEALHGKSFATGMQGGGEAAQFRSAVDDLTNRYGFAVFAADMDPVAAEGLALRVVDRAVKAGERYVYRVFSPRKSPEVLLDTAYAFGSAQPFIEPPAPANLRVQEEDGMLIVRWSAPPVGERYSGYVVSRSDNGGKTYTTLTLSPLVNPTPTTASAEAEPAYTDTSVVNYRRYRYQVRGISPFGDLSQPSEVEGMARDLTPPPAPVGLKVSQLTRARVRLSWVVEDSTADMVGFVVLRSPLPLSGYHLAGEGPFPAELAADRRAMGRVMRDRALPRRTRSFLDTLATPFEPYYSVAAVDTAGNYLQSLPIYSELIDTVPPSIPRGLTGSVDTNGVVRLQWRRGNEPTLLGYRVYQANDSTHRFHVRTPHPVSDTVFVDTIDVRTLSRDVYYRLAAVNNRFVHSPLTPILRLRRPDVVRPVPPVFTEVTVTDSSVLLRWASSPSTDVHRQDLWRRYADSTMWTLVDSLDGRRESYTDRGVRRRVTYEYRLVAVDSSGLRSDPAFSILARPYDTGIRPPVSDLRITYDGQTRAARLSWSYAPAVQENFWFVVYRAAAGAPLTQYRAVEGTGRSFEDKPLAPGSYQYAVKVMSAAGGQGLLTGPVRVEAR